MQDAERGEDALRARLIPAVYGLLIRDGELLLLRRSNTGYEDGKYGLVAGHVENGESFTEAMVREAKEEVGILLAAANLELAHVMQRPAEARIDLFFNVGEWTGQPVIAEPDKCDDLIWSPLDRLPETTIPYIRTAIDLARRGVLYSQVSAGLEAQPVSGQHWGSAPEPDLPTKQSPTSPR